MKHTSLIFIVAVLAACTPAKETKSDVNAFTGATIIDGNGGEPIQDGILLIRKGEIVAVGTPQSVQIPEGAMITDVSGKYIIPGLINAHGHVGEVKGIDGGHYSTENVRENLEIYARYGVTTVVSLGGDKKEGEALRAVNDTTSGHARLFIAGEIITGSTPEGGNAIVDRNHAMGVDLMKIRVDDNLGTTQKVPEEVYRVAIARAHELGYKVATHMYYLEDARKLLEAGTDMMAHSVRDKPVDEAFVRRMAEKRVCYCPTFTRELSTFVYGDTAEFFNDPFFKREYDSLTIQPLKDPARQLQIRDSKNAITYRKQLPVAMANMMALSDAGVPIVFGTDSGVPTRFIGYFEHLELAMMAEAGLTPMQIIMSATKTAAECMNLKGLGTLIAGNKADFIVLENNPLEDILNSRTISKVYIGGFEVGPKP